MTLFRGRRSGDAGDEEVEAAGADGDFEAGCGGVGLAIGVEETGAGKFDDEMGGAEAEDVRTAVDPSEKKAGHQLQGAGKSDGAHGNQVELAVVHTRAGSDERAVAVLVGVGDRDEQHGEFLATAGAVDGDGEIAARAEGDETGARVSGKAAVDEAVEAVADIGVEADAHGVEKGVAVDDTSVDGGGAGGGIGGEREGAAKIGGNAEMEGEPIAGTARDETERSGRVEESLGDLVHRAVAPYGDHAVATLREGRAGEEGGVARAGGRNERGVEPVPDDEGADVIREPRTTRVAAGAGVEDEARLHGAREK